MPDYKIRAMPKPRHEIWGMFTETAPRVKGSKDHPDAKCNACDKVIKNAAPSGNMLRHALKCNKLDKPTGDRWKQYDAELRHAKAAKLVTPRKTSPRSTPRVNKRLFGTPIRTPAPRTPRKTPRPTPSARTPQRQLQKRNEDNFLRVAMEFYATGVPFRVVEDPFFRAMFDYELPSRLQLAGRLLDAVYERERARVVVALKEAKYLALVTDGWSNKNGDSIINFVFVNPRFPPVFWKSFNTAAEVHDGVYIAEHILATIAEVEDLVGHEVVTALVTDNAKNMKRAWRLVMEQRQGIACAGCAAHGMNLVMKDTLNLNYFEGVVDDSKTLTRFFKNRSGIWSNFRDRQSQLRQNGGKRRRLSLPVPTRWYTHEKCIGNVVRNKDIVAAIFSDNSLLKRYEGAELDEALSIFKNDSFWSKAEAALKLLQPVNTSLAAFERDECSFSLIFNRFDELRSRPAYTKPLNGCPEAVQQAVLDIFDKRRHKVCTLTTKVAALLDQTLSLDVFDDDPTDIVDKATNLAKSMGLVALADEDVFYTQLQNFAADKTEWSAEKKRNSARYSPLKWWIIAPLRCERVKAFAKLVLSIPTSSASSERN